MLTHRQFSGILVAWTIIASTLVAHATGGVAEPHRLGETGSRPSASTSLIDILEAALAGHDREAALWRCGAR